MTNGYLIKISIIGFINYLKGIKRMKTMIKRILCFTVAICICCSVLPQIFGVMADATEPELSSKCETVIDIAGKDGSFGEDITDLRTSTSIKFSSTINLSDADIFELNVYIEDVEALKSAITETQYIQFGFSSSSRRATANHAEVDISSQLTQSGWNNICVNKSDFTETNINWNNIYYVFIRFANESIDLSTALTNKVVKIRNICESFAVPLSEGADVTLYDGFLNTTLGESADSLISSVGETFKVTTSVIDFTDVSLFNVDLYIPNISSFEAFIADKELRFVLSSEQGSASCKFSGGYSANSIANWYTVKLKMAEFIKDADFDITKVNEFKIEIIGNENEKLGSAYSLKFGFANVRGIKIISPENSIYGETLSEYIVSQQLLSFGETYADFNFEKSSDYSALGDCENIELDLYVDNYESFINSFLYDKNITSINASLDLILSNGTNTLTWKGIEKLIKKSGWNHIILSVVEADNNGFDINSNFSCINLNISDVDSTLMNPNCDGIIVVDNMVATKGVAEPQLPDNIDNILIEELNVNYGKDLPLTFDPNGGYHARKIIDTALDLSSADYIEFDIYVSDAELLKAYDNLYLSLYPSENGYNGHRADFDFKEQLKTDGWNHIKVKKTSARSRGATGSYPYSIDWTNISAVALMTYQSGAPNVTGTGFAVIANVCATLKGEFKVPDNMINSMPTLPSNIDSILLDSYFVAEYGEDISLQYWVTGSNAVVKRVNPTVDMSKSDFIEFDIYVSDVEKLKAYDAYSLYVSFYTTENGIAGQRADYAFIDQVTTEGWNHIKVDKKSARSRGAAGSYPYNLDWTNVCAVALMTYSAGVPQAIGTEFAVIANVCGTLGEESMIPNLPENVITEIKEVSAGLLGDYFGYVVDRIYSQGIGPYDFSKGSSIEFDIYVSDYEKLKQVFAETQRGQKFALVLSSVPLKLHSQYNKPREYYSVHCDLTDKITKTGWNHIKLGKDDFTQLLGQMDWSNITSYMLRFSNSKFNKTDEEKNPASDVYIKIANLVNTGIVSDVPYDENKPEKPDKEAVYISDAENLVDDNGSWNPSEVYVDENYKSENSHSVMKNITYETVPEFSKMFYLFDYSADMSDIKTLKFDLFVDLPQFIQKSGNMFEVGLSSKRDLDGNYTWKIDTSTLKEGWNSLSFDFSKALKNGDVSLDEIKTVFVRFSEINLNAEEYESIIIGVDNLRYLSNDGNTTLKINGAIDDNDYNDNDYNYNDLEFNTNDNVDVEVDTQEVITETITSEPKTIHLKETVNKVVTNYTLAIIILAAEFAVLMTATIVGFVLIKKKKKGII